MSDQSRWELLHQFDGLVERGFRFVSSPFAPPGVIYVINPEYLNPPVIDWPVFLPPPPEPLPEHLRGSSRLTNLSS